MRSDRERLLDIQEALANIGRYTASGRAGFDEDELVRSWVVRHLQIIAEAASRLSSELQRAHPDVPWREVTGMRNVLTHGYFDIDPDVVWSVVENDLPDLENRVRDMLADLDQDDR